MKVVLESLSDVLGQISERKVPVNVVAIDGHSAAGKSTFAAGLAAETAATVVHGDDFYRVMDDVDRVALGAEEGAASYDDWERMRDEALGPLRAGRRAEFRPYDWNANALADRVIVIEPQPPVIVEGLFVSRPELADLVDLTVLITADSAVRRQRQLTRADASASWLERWDAAERWFFERVRQPTTFDVVVALSHRP